MNILHDIGDFLKAQWLPPLVGFIGGLAGAYSFIDSYIIKFKPKIFVGTRVIIHFIDESKTFPTSIINSIICSMEICNHRKKYGVMYDFAVRIYNTDAINPQAQIYYVSETANKIPIKIDEFEKQEILSFTPFTVLPNSNKSVNLILSGVQFSKMRNRKSESFYLEFYYQMKPAGKWYFVDRLYLYNEAQGEQIMDAYQLYTVLDSSVSREKLSKAIRPPNTNLFSGVSHRYFYYKQLDIYDKVFKNSILRAKDLFISVPFYLHFLKDLIVDRFIKMPIINKNAKAVRQQSVKINNPELRPSTEKVFEEIYQYLITFVTEINSGATTEALITVDKKDRQIVIYRYRLSLIIYVSGDTNIRVQEQNSFSGSKLTYDLSLKSALWNRRYWYLDNYGFISIKSFIVRVLDALIMHSN